MGNQTRPARAACSDPGGLPGSITLGFVEPVRVDVRIIAATNQNLERLVGEGTFRQDLHYRIHVVKVDVPPLEERREDIPLLADHFIAIYNRLHDQEIAGLSR